MAILGHPKFKGSSSCSDSNCTGTCTLSSSSTSYYNIKCNGCSSTCRMEVTASITKCNNCDYSCAFGCGSTSGAIVHGVRLHVTMVVPLIVITNVLQLSMELYLQLMKSMTVEMLLYTE